jgi:hypothetical protein
MTLMTGQGTEFDRALLGHPCWLESQAGERIPLPVQRWRTDYGSTGLTGSAVRRTAECGGRWFATLVRR